MVTSFPTNKFGSAPGISAPCNIPRPNPAGVVLFAMLTDTSRRQIPTIVAASKKEKMRLRIFWRLELGCIGPLWISVIVRTPEA
jgi:hypothetical protein